MASAAEHVDKILRGAKPREIPVEQPTKFEFVINLKAAKRPLLPAHESEHGAAKMAYSTTKSAEAISVPGMSRLSAFAD